MLLHFWQTHYSLETESMWSGHEIELKQQLYVIRVKANWVVQNVYNLTLKVLYLFIQYLFQTADVTFWWLMTWQMKAINHKRLFWFDLSGGFLLSNHAFVRILFWVLASKIRLWPFFSSRMPNSEAEVKNDSTRHLLYNLGWFVYHKWTMQQITLFRVSRYWW